MALFCKYFLAIIFIVCTSCSNLQSGRYLYVNGKFEVDRITKTYNIPLSVLKSLNPNYKHGKKGWVFVPIHPGFWKI